MVYSGVPVVAQWFRTQLVSIRTKVLSLASLRGLRIQHCHKLQCRSQMWLGSVVAVAVAQAGSCTSDSSLNLETSIWQGVVLKRKKEKRKRKEKAMKIK